MATIADFLKSIGMAEYAAGLSDSGIEVSALPGLTERDLERLGIASGDRDRLLRAIAGFHPDLKLDARGQASRSQRRTPPSHDSLLRPCRFDCDLHSSGPRSA